MKYVVKECFPSQAKLQEMLDSMSGKGWFLKATLRDVSTRFGWLTLIFEKPAE